MPIVLADLVEPTTTAVLTMEVQRGVCGDLASMPALADVATGAGLVDSIVTVLGAARCAGVTVVHCTYSMVPDRTVSPLNTPLLQRLARNPEHMLDGTPVVELCQGLLGNGDLLSNRHHGMSPFIGTGLDALLRERGVGTVVVTGVSLNLGIPGTVIEAVNSGYRVVIVRECVVGVPIEFGEQVLANSLAVAATIVTSADLVAAWQDA